MRADHRAATGSLGRAVFLSRTGRVSWAVFRTVLVTGICFIIVYPVLVQLSLAFMDYTDMYDLSVHWIPRHFTLRNFQIAISQLSFGRAFVNSLGLAGGQAVLQVLSSTVVGYGLARFRFRGSRLVFALVVFTLLVPPSLVSVPLFLNFRFFTLFGLLKAPGLNLIGSPWPLFLLSLTATAKRCGLFIFMTRQYFRTMPTTIEEAAYVDGAGTVQTFARFMLPNAIPVVVIVFLFAFVWQWNDIFYTDFFLRGRELLSLNFQALTDKFAYSWSSPFIEGSHIRLVSNAGILLYIAPVLVLYAFLQRYFVESITRTGIVG
jgi:multiple sugar transport system permease protein